MFLPDPLQCEMNQSPNNPNVIHDEVLGDLVMEDEEYEAPDGHTEKMFSSVGVDDQENRSASQDGVLADNDEANSKESVSKDLMIPEADEHLKEKKTNPDTVSVEERIAGDIPSDKVKTSNDDICLEEPNRAIANVVISVDVQYFDSHNIDLNDKTVYSTYTKFDLDTMKPGETSVFYPKTTNPAIKQLSRQAAMILFDSNRAAIEQAKKSDGSHLPNCYPGVNNKLRPTNNFLLDSAMSTNQGIPNLNDQEPIAKRPLHPSQENKGYDTYQNWMTSYLNKKLAQDQPKWVCFSINLFAQILFSYLAGCTTRSKSAYGSRPNT